VKKNNYQKSQEIRDEIKEIAPTLSNIEKSNPYGLPMNYFEGLPNQISSKLTTNPYKVSDKYFEQLADNIQESIKNQKEDSKPKIRLLKIVSGIAASILLIGAMYFLYPQEPAEVSNGLAVAESELFLEENIHELDIEELMELGLTMDDAPLDSEPLSKEVLEIYLEENIEDFNIEELTELL